MLLKKTEGTGVPWLLCCMKFELVEEANKVKGDSRTRFLDPDCLPLARVQALSNGAGFARCAGPCRLLSTVPIAHCLLGWMRPLPFLTEGRVVPGIQNVSGLRGLCGF